VQITNTVRLSVGEFALPFFLRITILHRLQIFLTDGLTFITILHKHG